MSWTYCRCGCGMDTPTTRQVLEEDYRCPDCGSVVDTLVSLQDVVLQLLQRIELLENEHGIHT